MVAVVGSCLFEKSKNYLQGPGISWGISEAGRCAGEWGGEKLCVAAKLGEERGTEQMGGGGRRGVGSSAHTSVTRSDKLLLD